MRTLLWLLELLWVAQEHDVPRALTGGQHVGERHLTGFVHEQYIEFFVRFRAGPQERSSTDDGSLAAVHQVVDVLVLFILNDAPLYLAWVGDLSRTFDSDTGFICDFQYRLQQIDDDLVARGRDAHPRTAFHQLTDH